MTLKNVRNVFEVTRNYAIAMDFDKELLNDNNKERIEKEF